MAKRSIDGKPLQWLSSLTATLTFLSVGMQSAWYSPALENHEFKERFHLTPAETSWLVSILNIGAIFGSILSGFLVDAIGRKWCIFANNLPGILGWVLVYSGYLETDLNALYASSIISGVALGMTLNSVPIYVGEISSTDIRGALGTLSALMINVGILYEYVCGPFVSVPFLAVTSGVVPIVGAIGMIFVPESPEYLLGKNREDEAKASLQRLRGTAAVEEELADIKKDIKAKKSTGGWRSSLSRAGKPILIVSLLGFLQQASGNAVIVSYFEEVYNENHPPLSSIYANIIVGILTLVTGVLATWTVEKMGRRLLSHISCGIQAVAYTILGLFYMFKDHENVKCVSWLPLLLLAIILGAYNLGQGPLVFVLIGEILPKEARAMGATVGVLSLSAGAFVSTKMYPLIDPFISFLTFGALIVLTAAFYYSVVPETRGIEREEIRRLMKRKASVFTISSNKSGKTLDNQAFYDVVTVLESKTSPVVV